MIHGFMLMEDVEKTKVAFSKAIHFLSKAFEI